MYVWEYEEVCVLCEECCDDNSGGQKMYVVQIECVILSMCGLDG